MNKFLFVFYGGKMETDPKIVEKSMALWNKWYADLGKAVIDGGNPTMPGKIVNESGMKSVGATPITGYSILPAGLKRAFRPVEGKRKFLSAYFSGVPASLL